MARFPGFNEEDLTMVVSIESQLSYAERKADTASREFRQRQLLSTNCRQLLDVETTQQLVIFKVEGLISPHTETTFTGIGPSQARPGDQVVQFMDCDVSIILRQQSPGLYCVIGRALLLNEQPSDHTMIASKYKFRVPDYRLLDCPENVFFVHMDISTLQILTM